MKFLKVLFSVSFLFIFLNIFSQNNLPIVHANTDLIDVRDGDNFSKGGWYLAPEANPDVYTTNSKGKYVTFYTDIDSISYLIHPDSVYDFIVLYKNKDTCYTQIKWEPSYLDILVAAEEYDYQDNNPVPTFIYQDSSNQHLKALRNGFNLDSIAGGGHEISKLLNLMHWVHDLIPHDGNHPNPEVKNAMSMIGQCKKEERGLNCRGLAILLNECYLSLGFKSRFVTCMPKDSVFNDCHVINTVYSNDLKKWIWLDPTHDAYIMDEKGTLLGLGEARKRLIKGQTLILNPNANWNYKNSTVKSHYLDYYMAKNLYRLECPVRSEYNYETWKKGKKVEYVELLPLDAFNQTPKKTERTNKESGVTFIKYRTNNPDVFWEKPIN